MPITEPLRHALETRKAGVGFVDFQESPRDGLPQALAAIGWRILSGERAKPGSDPDGNFCDREWLAEADVVVINARICLNAARGANTSILGESAGILARFLRPNQLVVLCGMVPPGTTRTILLPLLAAGQLSPGRGFFLAYTPDTEIAQYPRIIGGLDATSQELATLFFQHTNTPLIPVSSLETAELCGLLASVYRTAQTALGNELQVLCDKIGADAKEALEATRLLDLAPAQTPRDSAASMLAWGARRFGVSSRLIELAAEINSTSIAFVYTKMQEMLNTVAKPLRGSRVLILGLTVGGTLGSGLLEQLHKKGAIVSYHDPDLPELIPIEDRPHPSCRRTPLTLEVLRAQDVVVVLDDHPSYDHGFLVGQSRLLLDARNRPALHVRAGTRS